MIIRKPPMGWNTWNTFGPNISEQLIMESARAMVDTGLKDAGYEYIVTADMLGLPEEKALRMRVTDLWTGQEVPLVNGTIPNPGLNAHSCQVYRIHLEG